MKITIDGKEFNAIPVEESLDYYLEPVKKTEKIKYNLKFMGRSIESYTRIDEDLELTEPTANKLSEAISALVEFVTRKTYSPEVEDKLDKKIEEVWLSFQESQ